MTNRRDKIATLDTIRCIAFLAVLICHVDLNSEFLSGINLGSWAVSVFLVLSGFVMIYSYYDTGRLEIGGGAKVI